MIQIDETRCVGCGTCVEDCVSGTIKLVDNKARVDEECFQCGHCVAICPHEAVSIPNYSDACISYDEATFDLPTQNVLNTIKFRRSIRRFTSDAVTYDDLHVLMDAAAHMPTAKNTQACRFVFIQDSLEQMKETLWSNLWTAYRAGEETPLPREVLERFFALKGIDAQQSGAEHVCTDGACSDPVRGECVGAPVDFLFRNAPAVLCIQAPDPVDAGLAAAAIELAGTTRGIGVLYNGYLRRAIAGMSDVQQYLDMDLNEKPLVVCMLIGYPDVTYRRTAPRRNPSVVLR
ncbi:MAG: nitroreductase family protein [Eggerthellaceae bacterium]